MVAAEGAMTQSSLAGSRHPELENIQEKRTAYKNVYVYKPEHAEHFATDLFDTVGIINSNWREKPHWKVHTGY